MSAPDIHPENLLEKFAAGGLNPNEHELVQEHLAGCSACRFELLVRADLETEADVLEFDRISTRQLLLALPMAHSGILPSTESLPIASLGADDGRPALRRRRPWRRVVAITAAALGLASGAAALVATQVPNVSRTLDVTARPSTPTTPKQQHDRGRGTAAARPQTAPPQPSLSALPLQSVPAETAPVQASERPTSAASRADALRKNDDALSAAQLFSDANQARRASNPARATELYRLLQRKFPRSQEAQLSLVTLGSLQLNGGNAGGALATFNRYLSHGGRSLEAEALYGKAQALRRLGRTSEERGVWERLLARYPGSGYAPQARERLDSLGGS